MHQDIVSLLYYCFILKRKCIFFCFLFVCNFRFRYELTQQLCLFMYYVRIWLHSHGITHNSNFCLLIICRNKFFRGILGPLVLILPKIFSLFCFSIFWSWAYLMKVIPESCMITKNILGILKKVLRIETNVLDLPIYLFLRSTSSIIFMTHLQA